MEPRAEYHTRAASSPAISPSSSKLGIWAAACVAHPNVLITATAAISQRRGRILRRTEAGRTQIRRPGTICFFPVRAAPETTTSICLREVTAIIAASCLNMGIGVRELKVEAKLFSESRGTAQACVFRAGRAAARVAPP